MNKKDFDELNEILNLLDSKDNELKQLGTKLFFESNYYKEREDCVYHLCVDGLNWSNQFFKFNSLKAISYQGLYHTIWKILQKEIKFYKIEEYGE